MAQPGFVDCSQFPQFLVDQQPYYDEMIVQDIRPTDGWLLNIDQGTVPTGTPTDITIDRFKHVYPNTSKKWNRVAAGSCVGTPCDKTEYCIGWGSERRTYYAQEQSWATPLVCFDQAMHVTHAKEQFGQIIADIMRPATLEISSMFARKGALQWAGKKWAANKTMDDFVYRWTTAANGEDEVYFDCNVASDNVFKLVPQMLQRRFNRLMGLGYAGKNPYKDTAPFIELVTDTDTCWELDRMGGATGVGGTPSIAGNWRFTQWGDTSEYWRYGFSGQIGNYLVRTDMHGFRFNYVGLTGDQTYPYRYQLVLPYTNGVVSGAGGAAGIGSDWNTDFDAAQFRIGFIWHKKGMQLLTFNASPISGEMPFADRNFGGKWQFVMDNLGEDQNGCVIENKRRNKGQFIADFQYYMRPLNTELVEAFFYKAEPACVPEINTCNDDPGYPTQEYNSCDPICGSDAETDDDAEAELGTAENGLDDWTANTGSGGSWS